MAKLSFSKRKLLEDLLKKGVRRKNISQLLGINKSTIDREKKRCKGEYNAHEAHANVKQPRPPVDHSIIGKRFGILTILSYDCIKDRRSYWKAKCDCGNISYVSRKILNSDCERGRVLLSCGCLAKQKSSSSIYREIEICMASKYQKLREKIEEVDNCWLWLGYVSKGVPKCSWNNVVYNVRRVMFMIFNHHEPESNSVYASCGNRMCVNPAHLVDGRPPKNIYR